jgi:hypothetical protein
MATQRPRRQGSTTAGTRSYPLDAHGFVRQCAWCRRVADGAGRYRFPALSLLPEASHGCCRGCETRLRGRRASLDPLAF